MCEDTDDKQDANDHQFQASRFLTVQCLVQTCSLLVGLGEPEFFLKGSYGEEAKKDLAAFFCSLQMCQHLILINLSTIIATCWSCSDVRLQQRTLATRRTVKVP